MTIYLGLGANCGDRADNLTRAIDALAAQGFDIEKISPVVETPALLPPDADPAWDKPYLNLVVAGRADWSAADGLAIAKRIEQQLGRTAGPRWSPRPIDIDLLLWGAQQVNRGRLTVPHIDARTRDFVLTPLMHLRADLPLGENGETAFALTRAIRPIPLWMAVINLTPDSFSDGGEHQCINQLGAHFDNLLAHGVHIIDLGAESTRPGGEAIDATREWARLEPGLAQLAERLHGRRLRPWVSIDSRHPSTIDKAMRYGIDVINDVSGLSNVDMIALAKQSDCQVVAMHSVSLPAGGARLADSPSAHRQVNDWAEQQLESWRAAGLNLNRIILDPGIGFGKSARQSFDLLAHCAELRRHLRLLVGHSRKSMFANLGARPPNQRDIETLGASLAACAQGVDIIRVHAPLTHQRAYLAWAHVEAARLGGG